MGYNIAAYLKRGQHIRKCSSYHKSAKVHHCPRIITHRLTVTSIQLTAIGFGSTNKDNLIPGPVQQHVKIVHFPYCRQNLLTTITIFIYFLITV